MSIVNQFNGLNGATVTRKKILGMIQQAEKEEQPEIVSRLQAVVNGYPEHKKVTFNIESPAVESVPASLLGCFQIDDINETAGLGKVSQQDIYDRVTEMILNTIAKVGHLPWQKEWTGSGGNAAKNYVTKKTYTGINFIMLNFEQKVDADGNPYLQQIQFKEPYYLTFKQIESAGAKLKKGSKASQVFYYTPLLTYRNGDVNISTSDSEKFKSFVKQNNISDAELKEHGGKIPVIKYYNVYRADDCTGLKFPEKPEQSTIEPIKIAQAIIDNYPKPPKYTFGGDGAFYMPKADVLNMPVIEDFSSPAYYYSTYFHEMVHSTGHSKRLDRGNDTRRRDGSAEDKKAYAFEELVAELGAVYLCSEAGILFHTKENNAKYLAHWNKQLTALLKEDNRFFFRAAAAAQKGSDHILDFDTDHVAAYLRNEIEAKPAKNEKAPPKSRKKPTIKVTDVIAYALLDNISGEVVASKKTLPELEKIYISLEITTKALPPIVYEIKELKGKNVLGAKVSVDWKHPGIKVKRKPAKQLNLFDGLNGKKRKPAALNAPMVTESNPDAESVTEDEIIEESTSQVEKRTPIIPVQLVNSKSKNSKVCKIGGSGEPSEWITMEGEIAKYLQRVERKPVHSVVITMDGEKGAGKTTTLYKMIDGFYRPGNRCVFFSLEEHPSSALAKEKALEILHPDTAANLDTVGELDNVQEFYEIVAEYDIIFIDSWQKLVRMVGALRLDEDLRKKFHGKVFVIIFQQTTTGSTKGGAEIGFDGDIIIKMVKERVFEDNYAYFDKHRYTLVPIETIRYNIASGTIYNPESINCPEEQIETITPQASTLGLAFTYN